MILNKVNVLVTGGTGFFGHNLVLELLKDTRVGDIHIVSRNPPVKDTKSPFYDPEHKGRFHFFHGNIEDKELLQRAMKGCEIVFHACGDTRWWNAINAEQYRTNVVGTINVVNRCLEPESTVKRLVYTSTVDVLGHQRNGEDALIIDETMDYADPHDQYSFRDFGYNYGDTKRLADSLCRMMCNSRINDDSAIDFRLCVIRAGSMIGPWDVTNQYGRLFKELKEQKVAGIPSGGASVCHVADVAKLHVTMAFSTNELIDKQPVVIAAGSNVSYKELFHDMRSQFSKATLAKMPKTIGGCCGYEVIPGPLLTLYGWFCEQYSNYWSHQEPEINPGMARYMSCRCQYYGLAAVKHYGYPSDKEEVDRYFKALKHSYDWYAERGKI